MQIVLRIVTKSKQEAMQVASDYEAGKLPVEIKGPLDAIEIVQPVGKINLSPRAEVSRPTQTLIDQK